MTLKAKWFTCTATCLLVSGTLLADEMDDYNLTPQQKEAITLVKERERCIENYNSDPEHIKLRDAYANEARAAREAFGAELRAYEEINEKYWEQAWQLYIDHDLLDSDLAVTKNNMVGLRFAATTREEWISLRETHLGPVPKKPELNSPNADRISIYKLCAKEIAAARATDNIVRDVIRLIGDDAYYKLVTPEL